MSLPEANFSEVSHGMLYSLAAGHDTSPGLLLMVLLLSAVPLPQVAQAALTVH
jgi:hypothetical protein